jgi:hypothetical protein
MSAPQIILVALVICASVVAFLVKTAPLGYETDEGFHYGEPPHDHGA